MVSSWRRHLLSLFDFFRNVKLRTFKHKSKEKATNDQHQDNGSRSNPVLAEEDARVSKGSRIPHKAADNKDTPRSLDLIKDNGHDLDNLQSRRRSNSNVHDNTPVLVTPRPTPRDISDPIPNVIATPSPSLLASHQGNSQISIQPPQEETNTSQYLGDLDDDEASIETTIGNPVLSRVNGSSKQIRSSGSLKKHHRRSNSGSSPSWSPDKVRLFNEKLDECKRLIAGKFVNPKPENSNLITSPTFVMLQQLRKAFNEEKMEELLSLTPWYNKDWKDKLYTQFLCIIAILIFIDFKEWERFDEIFYGQREGNKLSRCDLNLPFELEDLCFLQGSGTQLLFYSYQSIFVPEIFEEDTVSDAPLRKYTERNRLPFTERIQISGGSRSIDKATIAKRGILEMKQSEARLVENLEPKVVALKTFTDPKPFNRERNINLKIKQARLYHDHIVMMVTSYMMHPSMAARPDLVIMYPWAQTDLQKLLFGLKPLCDEIEITSDRFTPSRILKQIIGVLDALQFLHDKLQLIHLDLKPENIFIYALNWFEGGVFKIADFGGAKERLETGDVDPSMTKGSSVSAPRGPGTYLAPEVIYKKGRCTTRTDSYSVGCILAVLFAFSKGGPQAVIDFLKQRIDDNGGGDFFYQTVGGVIKKNPNIMKWLSQLMESQWSGDMSWEKDLLQLIDSLLTIDRDSRPTASQALKRVKGISEALDNSGPHGLKSPWRYEKSTSDLSTLVANLNASVGSTTDYSEQSQQCSKRISQMVAHASLWCAGLASYHYISIPLQPLVTRASRGWIAVMSETQVLIYDLGEIIDLQSERPSELSPIEASNRTQFEYTFSISADQGETFEDIRLGGDYLALVRRHTGAGGDRGVSVHHLRDSHLSKSLTRRWMLDDCFDVVVSAQGALARMFPNHVKISTTDDAEEMFTYIHDTPNIRTAAFSENGDYFCLWNRGNDKKNWWRTWSMADIKENRHTCKFSAETEFGILFRSTIGHSERVPALIATTDGCSFFAFDWDRKVWFISQQENERVASKVTRLGTDAVLLPISESTCITLSQTDGTVSASASMGVTTPGKSQSAAFELDHVLDKQWVRASPSPIIGATAFTAKQGQGFVLLYSDGVLERRLAKRE